MSTLAPKATSLLSRENLCEFFQHGCKPRERWRIGTECEVFAVEPETGLPVPYAGPRGILAILHYLIAKYGWAPIEEGVNLIGLSRGEQTLSLEPGGQIELSGAPLADIHQTARELQAHVTELASVEAEFGLRILWCGLHPTARLADVDLVPKQRYAVMDRYLPTRGALATTMMRRTCTVQANLDYSSEPDAARKIWVAQRVGPLVTALFANSNLLEGQPSGYRSFRQHVWTQMDSDRSGPLPWLEPSPPQDLFEQYARWALEVPMFFVFREGSYVDQSGIPFETLLAGQLPGLSATDADWELHLSTLFPDARLKTFIEARTADGVPPEFIPALPALWKGLLYDQGALEATTELIGSKLQMGTSRAMAVAARDGLAGRLEGTEQTLAEVAVELLAIAADSLARQACLDEHGRDESVYLEGLIGLAASGKDPGETLSERLRHAMSP